MARPYTIKTPLPGASFGAVIENFTLKLEHCRNVTFMNQLKEDVHKYLVVLFKDQELPSVEGKPMQIHVSEGLGTIESTFSKHQASPHPDIFRVSNERKEGCTGVGRTGWHIDGTFMNRPFSFQTMHFPAVNREGHTEFVPLQQLYEEQSDETRKKWDEMWFIASREVFHPLVYTHPISGNKTMCFHCGEPFCAAWAINPGAEDQFLHPPRPTQNEITNAIDASRHKYRMKWDKNDFAIMDNTAVAHYAVPGTQDSANSGGLRILHRTTIAGTHEPLRNKKDAKGGLHADTRRLLQMRGESLNEELPDHSSMKRKR